MPNRIELEFTINEDHESGILKLGDDLNIQGANSLKEAISDALRYVDNCILDLERVGSYDLSCIQVLHAALQTAESTNKQITLLGKCPANFKKAVTDLGFAHLKWFSSDD